MQRLQESPRQDVAAIVVNWKEPVLTERCIRSILSGTVIPGTIIVVENETRDFSASFMRSEAATEPGGPQILRICSMVNRGYAGGVNLGIEAALQLQPDCVVLINNDVVVDSDSIERLCATRQKFDAAIVGGRCLDEARDRDVGFPRRWPAALWGRGVVVAREACSIVGADMVDGAFWLVGRDCLEITMERRGFYLDPLYFLYWEDADLCMFVRRMGMKCLFDGQATARHDVAASSGGKYNTRGLYYQTRNLLLFTFRWSPPGKLVLYLPMVLLNRFAALTKHLASRRFPQAQAVLRGIWHGLLGVRWKSLKT